MYSQPGAHAVSVGVSGDGAAGTAGSVIDGLVYLPDGSRGTPDQRFVSEAFEDRFDPPPTLARLEKYGRRLKSNRGRFVTALLQTPSLRKQFLLNEVSVLYAALTGQTASGGLVHKAVSRLQAGGSLEQVAHEWTGAPAGALDQALVGG